MKKTLRSLSLIAAFALMATIIPLLRGGGLTAYASSDFTVENGVLTAYTGDDATVTIPSTVTRIKSTAFQTSYSMTKIVIPTSVTTIDNTAFDRCSKLKEFSVSGNSYFTTTEGGVLFTKDLKKIVKYPAGRTSTSFKIPSSVTTIGNSAFYKANNLTSVTVQSGVTTIETWGFCAMDKLKTISLPSTLQTIGVYAFSSDKAMTSITIPSSVKKINKCAFNECTGLKTVTMGSSVEEIGESAFVGCTSLTYITIPESVTKIGKYAFSGCTGMKYISINSKAPTIMAGGDILQSCPIEAFSYIGGYTDWNDSGWKYITCLNTDEVGNYLNQNVVDKVFKGFTTYGTSHSIADFVTTIGSGAFDTNGDMASLGLPASLVSYNKDVFDKCTNLQSFVIDSSNTKFKTTDGVLYSKDGKTLIRYPIAKSGTSFTVPSTVTTIGYSAFYKNANLTKVVMNSPVAVIDEYAFDASHLTAIDIPSSVTTVKKYAFGSINGTISKVTIRVPDTTVDSTAFSGDTITDLCFGGYSDDWNSSSWKTALTDKYTNIHYWYWVSNGKLLEYFGYSTGFAVPSGVTEISSGAFSRSPQMNAITISETVTTIPASTFDALKSLTAINVNANNTTFKSDGGVLYTKDGKTVLRYPIAKTGTAFTVPSGVTTIANSAFYSVKNLEALTLPSSLTKIEGWGINSVTKIEVLTIPKSVTTVEKYAFGYLTGLNYLNIQAKNPSVVSTAFNGTANIKVLTYIGTSSEWTSSNWYAVDNIKSKTKYCNSEVNDYTIVKYNDSTATSVNLPEFATYINNGALPTTLTSVTLPKALTGYDAYLFDSCKALTAIYVQSGSTNFKSVSGVLYSYDGKTLMRYPIAKASESYSIPDTVTKIANSAFYQCKNIKHLTVPSSVTNIDNYGLATGNVLTTLNINAKNPTIASTNAFSSTTVTTVNYNGTLTEWNASNWKSVLSGKYTNLNTLPDITITQQPTNQYIVLGKPVTVSVKATGSGLTYQWYFKKKGQTSFSVWSGRTKASETCTPNVSWEAFSSIASSRTAPAQPRRPTPSPSACFRSPPSPRARPLPKAAP